MNFKEIRNYVNGLMSSEGAFIYDEREDCVIWICDDEEHQWVLDYEMDSDGGLTLSYCSADEPLDMAYLDEDDDYETRSAVQAVIDRNSGYDPW